MDHPPASRFAFRISRFSLLLVVVTLLLPACGTFEVGVVPTPTPTPSILRYENTDYGFAFTYPSHWTLEEASHIVWLRKGTLVLHIAYRHVNEAWPLPPPDQSAADGNASVGKLSFLGQAMSGEGLMYQRKMKAVVYHAPKPQTSEDLEFSISLKDTVGDASIEAYERVDITDEVVDEVGAILESFERIPVAADVASAATAASATLTPQPSPTAPPPTVIPTPTSDAYPGWARYVNAEYGFAFRYPLTWALAQVPGGQETPFGPSADTIRLTRDDLVLEIQYQHAGENHFLGTGDVAAGNFVERGPVAFMGTSVYKSVLVFQDKDKSMSLRFKNDTLEFFINLGEDIKSDTSYEMVMLSESAQAEVDRILRSFDRVSTP